MVTLYTNAGSGWVAVATHTLVDPIPAATALDGFEMVIPLADWGDRQVLHIVGTHADECDYVNDRIPVTQTACE